MTYLIFFTLFGRNMKYRIEADSQESAIRKLRDKIVIHRVDVDTPPRDEDPTVEYLKNIFGMK